MSAFDPTQHPRGNSRTGHAGQFAAKHQSGAEITLPDVPGIPAMPPVPPVPSAPRFAPGSDADDIEAMVYRKGEPRSADNAVIERMPLFGLPPRLDRKSAPPRIGRAPMPPRI